MAVSTTYIAGIIDDVGVVACSTDESIGSGAAFECIVTASGSQHIDRAVTHQEIVQIVSGAVNGGAARESQVLNIVAQCETDGTLNRVSAFVDLFNRGIARADDIRIIAHSTVQHIGGAVAGQNVVQAIARAIDCLTPGERQILDIRAQRPTDRTLDRIDAFIDLLNHRVAEADDIGVITCPTGEHVHGVVAGQHIVQAIARAVDRRIAGQGEILEVGKS